MFQTLVRIILENCCLWQCSISTLSNIVPTGHWFSEIFAPRKHRAISEDIVGSTNSIGWVEAMDAVRHPTQYTIQTLLRTDSSGLKWQCCTSLMSPLCAGSVDTVITALNFNLKLGHQGSVTIIQNNADLHDTSLPISIFCFKKKTKREQKHRQRSSMLVQSPNACNS